MKFLNSSILIVYRAIRNGRLSRSSDGQFDLAEVIQCFGEPNSASQPSEFIEQSTDQATQKLITHLENEVKKYQDHEERLMQQIDRMQTLIELKSVAPTIVRSITENVAVLQPNATAYDTTTQQHATFQNVAMPQPKKRGLFGRVLNAVFSDD